MKRLFLFSLVVAAAALSAQHALDWPELSLRRIEIDRGLDPETVEQIRTVASDLHGSLLKLNLASVRSRLEQLPNVRSSTVSRKYPDRLVIDVERHEPLARWAPGGLVNIQGEIYTGSAFDWLPIFDGPSSRLSEMSGYYFYARSILGGLPENQSLVQLRVSARGEWQVFLNNGWVLNLGSRNIHARLKRFVEQYRQIVAHFDEVKYVDLRYPNGMAVMGERAPENEKEESLL